MIIEISSLFRMRVSSQSRLLSSTHKKARAVPPSVANQTISRTIAIYEESNIYAK
jgi:hypothetical protein